jgi:hypothetical protein
MSLLAKKVLEKFYHHLTEKQLLLLHQLKTTTIHEHGRMIRREKIIPKGYMSSINDREIIAMEIQNRTKRQLNV